jgi:hypothetical protein
VLVKQVRKHQAVRVAFQPYWEMVLQSYASNEHC